MSLLEENAAILRDMEAEGPDLAVPRPVDFSHVFPDEASAQAFAELAEQEGFSVRIDEIAEAEEPWDATASKDMVPTCENITNGEERLDALARTHGGRADGWGFFRA